MADCPAAGHGDRSLPQRGEVDRSVPAIDPRQRLSRGSPGGLVVDGMSDDETRQVIESFAAGARGCGW